MGHASASMEVSGLFSVLDNTAFPGGSLSVEERAALQASLILLKESQHFKEVRFWGKVRGLARDYLVCQGTIDEEMMNKCAAVNDLFTGDLGKVSGAAEGGEEGEVSADAVTEEKRLATLVNKIDEACAVAPKGALLLDARHRVVQSPSFRGIAAE